MEIQIIERSLSEIYNNKCKQHMSAMRELSKKSTSNYITNPNTKPLSNFLCYSNDTTNKEAYYTLHTHIA